MVAKRVIMRACLKRAIRALSVLFVLLCLSAAFIYFVASLDLYLRRASKPIADFPDGGDENNRFADWEAVIKRIADDDTMIANWEMIAKRMIAKRMIETELAAMFKRPESLCPRCNTREDRLYLTVVIACGAGWRTGDVVYHVHREVKMSDISSSFSLTRSSNPSAGLIFTLTLRGYATSVVWKACNQAHKWHPVSKEEHVEEEVFVEGILHGSIRPAPKGERMFIVEADFFDGSGEGEPLFVRKHLSVEVALDGKCNITDSPARSFQPKILKMIFKHSILTTFSSILMKSLHQACSETLKVNK